MSTTQKFKITFKQNLTCIFLLQSYWFSHFTMGPFIEYVSTFRGSENANFCLFRGGGGGPKILKTCLRNIWMVPNDISTLYQFYE